MSLISTLAISKVWEGEGNKLELKQQWGEAFIGSFDDVYLSRVINGQAEDELIDRTSFRRIPQDLVPEKSVRNMAPRAMEKHITHWKSIDARKGEDYGTIPSADWGHDAFAEKIEGFRALCQKFGKVLINEHFCTKFNKKYPSFTFGCGRRMLTLDDMVDFLENFELTPSQDMKLLRGMVRFVLFTMWHKNNPWAVHGERYIMDFCELEYSAGREMADGTKKARKHRGACVKAILVKQKGNLLKKVNEAYETSFLEKMYKRDVLTCEGIKLKDMGLIPRALSSHDIKMFMFYELMENPPDGINSSAWSPAKVASIKTLFQRASDAKYLIKCKTSTHGIEGMLLLSECNPGRHVVDHPGVRTAPATPPSSEKTEAEVFSIVNQYLKESNNKQKRGFMSMVKAQAQGRTDAFLHELANSSKEIFPDGKRIKVMYKEGDISEEEKEDDDESPLNRKQSARKTLVLSDSDDDDDSLLNERFGSRKDKKALNHTPEITSESDNESFAAPMDGIDTSEMPPASKPAAKVVAKAAVKPKATKKAALKAAPPTKVIAPVDNAANAAKFYDTSKPRELRMLEKDKHTTCQCATHLDVLSFSAYDHAYFTDAFVSKKMHWPKICFDCEGPFYVGPTEKEGHCKVDAKHQVYGCAHAMNGLHKCVKALCTPCRGNMISGKSSKRNRKAATQVMCGERVDTQGNISAA